MVNPLIRRAAFRAAHRFRRPIFVSAVGLAVLCSLTLGLTDSSMTENRNGMSRAYASIVWLEFAMVSVLALVQGAASIADERRLGTWESVCLTDLTGGELARGTLLGALLDPALVVLLAAPAQLAFAARGAVAWETVAGIHALLIGTALAMNGIGVMSSARTSRALHGVAFAAAAVIFLWFGVLDWLAARGVVPALCRTLQPIRQLEWLLGTAATRRPTALMTRAMGYLSFTGLVLIVTATVTAAWVRLSPDRARARLWKSPGRRRIRSVWDDPVRWRETYDPGGRRIVALVGAAALIPIVAWTVTAWDAKAQGVTHGLSKVSHGYLLTLTLAAGVLVGLRSAVTLVDERVRGTLELLRLVGVEPAAMIRSKLAAILTPALIMMPVIAIIAFLTYGEVFDTFVGPRAWLGAAGNVVVALAHVLLVAAISLLISAHARSSRVALLLEVVFLFVITLGPMALLVGASPFLPKSVALILAASSPLLQISLVGANATRFPMPVLLAVLGAELVISLVVIAWTCHSLERPAASPVVLFESRSSRQVTALS